MPRMPPLIILIIYCLLIISVSLLGGKLSTLIRMTHLRSQLLMSGVGGLMLGIAFLHLLPHGSELLQSTSQACSGALIGLVVMFLLVRLFHTHEHGESCGALPETGQGGSQSDAVKSHAQHAGESEVHHGSPEGHHHPEPAGKGLSWTGLFLGLLLHTLFDGVALASSLMADAQHGAWMGLAGLGTFLAVALHKPLDAFAITSVMSRQNWSSSAQNVANIGFSLACPVGAITFYLGATSLTDSTTLLGWGLAISAGLFVGIALADLLPEVTFHDHDRGKLTFSFLLGIGLALGIENLPGHEHGAHSPGAGQRRHDHSEHDHSEHDH